MCFLKVEIISYPAHSWSLCVLKSTDGGFEDIWGVFKDIWNIFKYDAPFIRKIAYTVKYHGFGMNFLAVVDADTREDLYRNNKKEKHWLG